MRESSTYQAILEEGRVEGEVRGRVAEARQIILDLGTSKFGAPDAATVAFLDRLDDVDTLHRLAVGTLTASTWEELLAAVDG
jgi:hypothetical protein